MAQKQLYIYFIYYFLACLLLVAVRYRLYRNQRSGPAIADKLRQYKAIIKWDVVAAVQPVVTASLRGATVMVDAPRAAAIN